jgi:hypothetical protein
VKVSCTFCEYEGEYPIEVHYRTSPHSPRRRLREEYLACVDTVACDIRWGKANPEKEGETE